MIRDAFRMHSRSAWPGGVQSGGVDSVGSSNWVFVALGGAAAVAVGIAVVETRRNFRGTPGTPAVYVNGEVPRLGPPTERCASNKHYRCDGRSRVGRSLVVQCGCTCHIPD